MIWSIAFVLIRGHNIRAFLSQHFKMRNWKTWPNSRPETVTNGLIYSLQFLIVGRDRLSSAWVPGS